MIESYRHSNDKDDLPGGYKNITHTALNYVQSAIENAGSPSDDATQNLINNIIYKRK